MIRWQNKRRQIDHGGFLDNGEKRKRVSEKKVILFSFGSHPSIFEALEKLL